MAFVIEFTPQAEDDMARLDKPVAQNVVNKIAWLAQNIEAIVPVPLKGRFKGMYKLRVDDWRVVYSFEQYPQIITICAVRHRSEVYKV